MGAPAAVYVDGTARPKKGSTRPDMAEIGPTSLDVAVVARRILAEERHLESRSGGGAPDTTVDRMH
jgi:hypothetical protein